MVKEYSSGRTASMKTYKSGVSGRTEDRIFDAVNYILLSIIFVVTLYPFINTLAVSFNDAIDTIRGGIYLWPREFSLYNYEIILKKPEIYNATFISFLRAVIGAATNILACLMVAYGISRKDFILRDFVTRLFVFTMYFSGGLIPYYFLIRDLHLNNSFLVYILPQLVSAFNIMVIRSYIDGLPGSLIESAKMDGASEYRILFSIILPLSVPVLATVTLWVAIGQWNSWFDTMLFNSSNKSLSTLQFELQKVLQSNQQIQTDGGYSAGQGGGKGRSVTPTSLRAAMTIVATAPILFVYPFLQKYFVKGLTLGGVKG